MVINRQILLVVILPTGGGKSLLFIVLAYLDTTSITIIIILYYTLANDLVDQIRRSRINYYKWIYGQVNLVIIVVISTDITGSGGFLNYVELLTTKKLL